MNNKIKSKLIMLLAFSLVISMMLFGTTKVSASSNPADAPDNWAFEASSVELNDAIISRYPQLNDGNGFITKTSASALTGMLDVSNMNVGGTINGIENFTNINQLYLASNQFTGEIPAGIGNLNYLYVLDLNDNQLTGKIPTDIGNLYNLLQLYLSNNRFTGEIPASIGNLSNLKHLYLSYNQLSGEIPTTISHLNYVYALYLNDNQFTSIQQATYDYITSKQLFDISNQEYITNQITPSLGGTDYKFDGLPAYEQFTNNSVFFTYTLKLPDGTSKTINPTISNGIVTIPASELTQIGDYSLVANGTSFDNRVTNFLYTTNFSLVDSVEYIKASPNGKKDKETSTKVTIDLSKVPAFGELTIDDITLTPQTKVTLSVNKDNLISLGNGKYELTISGTWDEGTIINVALTKSHTVFTPSIQVITLHKKATDTSENNNNNNSNNNSSNNNHTNNKNTGNVNISGDKKKLSTLPKTGDSNSFTSILLFLAESLIFCGYLIISKKEQ